MKAKTETVYHLLRLNLQPPRCLLFALEDPFLLEALVCLGIHHTFRTSHHLLGLQESSQHIRSRFHVPAERRLCVWFRVPLLIEFARHRILRLVVVFSEERIYLLSKSGTGVVDWDSAILKSIELDVEEGGFGNFGWRSVFG